MVCWSWSYEVHTALRLRRKLRVECSIFHVYNGRKTKWRRRTQVQSCSGARSSLMTITGLSQPNEAPLFSLLSSSCSPPSDRLLDSLASVNAPSVWNWIAGRISWITDWILSNKWAMSNSSWMEHFTSASHIFAQFNFEFSIYLNWTCCCGWV